MWMRATSNQSVHNRSHKVFPAPEKPSLLLVKPGRQTFVAAKGLEARIILLGWQNQVAPRLDA